jgi:hypothetical protein
LLICCGAGVVGQLPSADPSQRLERVMQALLQMQKIDIDTLQRAHDTA